MRILTVFCLALIVVGCSPTPRAPEAPTTGTAEVTAPASGSTERDLTVGTFTGLRFEAAGRVLIDPAIPAGVLHLEGPSGVLDRVETSLEGGLLIVRTRDPVIPGMERLEVRLAPPAGLDRLILAGVGSIEGLTVLKTPRLALEFSGVGQIRTELDVDALEVRQSGAGELRLSGRAGQAQFRVSGAGALDARDLKTQKAEAETSGVGAVDLRATEELKVRASGVGRVTFWGHPQRTDVQNSGLTQVTAGD